MKFATVVFSILILSGTPLFLDAFESERTGFVNYDSTLKVFEDSFEITGIDEIEKIDSILEFADEEEISERAGFDDMVMVKGDSILYQNSMCESCFLGIGELTNFEMGIVDEKFTVEIERFIANGCTQQSSEYNFRVLSHNLTVNPETLGNKVFQANYTATGYWIPIEEKRDTIDLHFTINSKVERVKRFNPNLDIWGKH